jgi:hypothetical protein
LVLEKLPEMLLPANTIRRAALAAVVLLTTAVFAAGVRAAALADYKEEVSHLRMDFDRLLFPEEELTGLEIMKLEDEVLAEAKEFAEKTVTVDVDGVEITSDNTWLREKVTEYLAGDRGYGSKGYEERRRIFSSIYERLGAIEAKLDELEAARAALTTKDANKRKLSEILKREEYRGPSENTDQSLAARVMKWISDMLQKLFPPRNTAPPRLEPSGLPTIAYALQIVLYGIVIALIGFLIYKFAPLLLKRGPKKGADDPRERVVLGEKIAADATTDELFSEAEKLAREGRLREALRKGYIALLFGLGERKMIGLAKHKTNRDYLKEIAQRGDLHNVVTRLTLTYERHWYGSEEANAEDWAAFQGEYARAVRTGKN